jgi:hypothetical protein
LLQLVFFQLAEEIGFTGFLQHHWQDRYSPMKLTLYLALLWAVWHMPDHFAEEGWGLEQLISAPVVFAIEFVSLFFARALIVWSYNRTGSSVLLVVPSDRLVSHVAPVRAPNQEAGRNLHARHATQWAQDWFTSSDGTSSATRRRRNHAKNTIGKRCAGKLPARIERGMENRPAQWSCAPDYQWMLM